MNTNFTELVIYPDEEPTRILSLEGAINFRDLGGYRSADGRQTRWGRVFRAAGLSRLTDNDLRALETLGVRYVCDLRNDDEVASEPDRLPGSVFYRRMPLLQTENYSDAIDAFLADLSNVEQSLTNGYLRHMVDHNARLYGELIQLAADPANQPFIFHCTAGKDRTGVAAALILLALGISEATVIADYSLSNLVANVFYDYLKNSPLGERIDIDQLTPLLTAPPQRMETVIRHIDTTYGSVEDYLLGAAGVPAEALAALRAALLE